MTSEQNDLVVIGNCQSRLIADCLAAMHPGLRIAAGFSRDIREGAVDIDTLVGSSRVVAVQTAMRRKVAETVQKLGASCEVLELPTLFFTGYHPDFIYAQHGADFVKSPLGNCNSAIVLAGMKAGASAGDIVAMFNADTFRTLGYLDNLGVAESMLIAESEELGWDLEEEVLAWRKFGCSFHTPNHPKTIVAATFARLITDRLSWTPRTRHPEFLIPDTLASNVVWPVYPEIGDAIGVPGEYVFKPSAGGRQAGRPLETLDLEAFVALSLEGYASLDPAGIVAARLDDERLSGLFSAPAKRSASSSRARQPYKGLPNNRFWNRVVAGVPPRDLDPVEKPRTKLRRQTKIATAGSCFAQHIAKALQESGFTYFVAEDGAHLPRDERIERQYGVFSARYANIYTAEQLRQLLEEAEGRRKPVETAWLRPDGRWVDPFRPQVEPDGYDSPEAVAAERATHLGHVRRLIRELEVFVFTLGLTEAWVDKRDGSVFPVAPGVAAGEMDDEKYGFRNFTFEENVESLSAALDILHSVNPQARVMFTVSPVPLAATYEPRHVLVSTTASKSILRAVADHFERTRNVEYFPSYEIITGSYNRGAYFADDLRSVTPDGVKHVMSVFLKHHTSSRAATSMSRELEQAKGVICEEELLSSAG
ncbi:GSCFA domain-containing protein [Brevundimonas balnearis]|uniref:GSCFA domain-containing protein n=1 Tax=Brevundimonas balnearis TaxID=1572858 RepID=A0ABV6QYX6_9CAUL